MKRIVLLITAVAVILIAFRSFSDPLPLGATLPKADLKMKDVSGKDVSFNDAKNKNGLLVMFSCNTCPWVIETNPGRMKLPLMLCQKKLGVILLNSNEGQRDDGDSYEKMKQYARNQGHNWYYVVDANSIMADELGTRRTPECFLFNANDKHVYYGAIDDNPANAVSRRHLKKAMDEMLAGKEITVKESRSMGCAIQRSE